MNQNNQSLDIEFNDNNILSSLFGVNDVNIQVVNGLGQLIQSNNYSVINGLLQTSIDVSDYSKGIYQVNVVSNNSIVTKTIIVK